MDKKTVSVDPAADAKAAIEAKYKVLGWDKDGHAPLNGGGAMQTQGGGGYVQYYALGTGKSAIYFYAGKGAFGMNQTEMSAYDAAGQDKFAYVVSDPKSCGTGCGYNDMIMKADNSEGINLSGFWVYGEIYKKYKAVNRWDGPMGVPTSSESNTPTTATDGSKFNEFYKGSSRGVIWFTPKSGAQAVWGKALKMYAAPDYERSWLKWPKSSCDPNKADNQQTVDFDNGRILTGPTCGAYLNKENETVYQNGTRAANVGNIPCYNL